VVVNMSVKRSYLGSLKGGALKKLDENSNNISRTAQEINVIRKMIRGWKNLSFFQKILIKTITNFWRIGSGQKPG